MRSFAVLAAAVVGMVSGESVDFARDVRPLLEERCFKCHSGDNAKSGLRLDARRIALRGGNSGEPAVAPGHPEQSRLLELVRGKEGERMPPRGEPLAEAEIALLEKWIADGASWPDSLSGDELVKEHWSFVKPTRPPLPAVERAWWPKSELDFFVLARQETEGLGPSPEAERATLLRRVSLDLTGLPPAPAEVDAFVNDRASDAYERQVDRLLASPAYGERWARMWLDLARYADSQGYGQDPLRPFLWRWRDWVIDAFNANLPYDQFTIEQLAGDLLPEPTEEQLLATAFHRNTMTNTEGGTVDEEFRVAAVKDRIDSTMAIWCGLTFGCARCHSHKFDPIPHKDYYRFFALFNQTEDTDRADEEPRIPTPTPEQRRERTELERKLAAVLDRREAKARDLGPAQARWETAVAKDERRWKVLRPDDVRSEQGTELAVEADGAVRASGPAPASDRYVVERGVSAAAPLDDISALRVEALADPSLPAGGPGRSAGNGNFVLNEVVVEVAPPRRTPTSARFVRISLQGGDRILSLAEVEVFAGAENLARRGAATQSSTDFDGPPELALDGNTSGEYVAAKSTTHTRQGEDPWWELDLGANRTIDRVVVWNRTDGSLQVRLAGARVELFVDEPAGRRLAWHTVLIAAPNPSVALDPAGPWSVALARASASFEQERFAIAKAIDGSEAADSGWAIGPQQGRSHVAVFEPAAPFTVPHGALLRVVLAQTYGSQHTLGRFRLSLWRGEAPPAALPGAVAAALARASRELDEAQKKLLADHYRAIAPELAPLNAEVKSAEEALAALDRAVVRTPIMRELPPDKRRTTHVQVKSNYLVLGPQVEPETPRALPPLLADAPRDRLSVARWLVSPDHPLTARVTVNRFWAQLFGRGIVETEEDFGTQGLPPTHPELLDWLAVRLVESGWDVKALLRTIVTSATYRQSSRVTDEQLGRDPRGLWLARYPRRRLEAEMVRDQALAVAGLLSPKLHGPSVFPPQPDGIWQVAFNGERTYPTSTGEERWRRGLYVFWRRTVPPPSLQTFDAPSREFCTLRRQMTNTPLQAFVTLNDPVYVEAAQAFARRAVREGGATTASRVEFMLRLALARPPREEEVATLAELFAEERARMGADVAAARQLAEQPLGPLPPELDPVELAALTAVANVVLNLDALLVGS